MRRRIKILRIVQGILMIPQFMLIVFGGIQVGEALGIDRNFSTGISVAFALYCLMAPFYPLLEMTLNDPPPNKNEPLD